MMGRRRASPQIHADMFSMSQSLRDDVSGSTEPPELFIGLFILSGFLARAFCGVWGLLLSYLWEKTFSRRSEFVKLFDSVWVW